jgi:hypothetical protein
MSPCGIVADNSFMPTACPLDPMSLPLLGIENEGPKGPPSKSLGEKFLNIPCCCLIPPQKTKKIH